LSWARVRGFLANLALGIFSLLLLLGACELALRFVPALLPPGGYGASEYKPELLSNVQGSTVTYNKVRFVRRKPNDEGFLDVDHDPKKPRGVVRIGFFGDSYVEAAQVPLDQVFYRRLPPKLAGRPVEPLGFGISGWGTLHSLLAYQVFAERYDLDVAVYVFVENDLGDNALDVQGARGGRLTAKVYATLSPLPPGYTLVLLNPPESLPWSMELGKVLQKHLLFVQVVWSRMALLAHGIALASDDRNVQMTTRAGERPNENDLPSSWPAPYSERAEQLGQRILAEWLRRCRADRRRLVVLYVPRGEDQLRGLLAPEDTWLPWLTATTRELGIPLVDPSAALRSRLDAGTPVYDDHWSPAGHEVVAGVLTQFLDGWLREQTR
jgi:hypothetical protein